MSEVGITNLGPVPEGMPFLDAIRASAPLRKHALNHYEGGDRLTICDTIRHAWRVLDTMPDSPEKETLREYLLAMGDFAKRMDLRMKALKAMLRDV